MNNNPEDGRNGDSQEVKPTTKSPSLDRGRNRWLILPAAAFALSLFTAAAAPTTPTWGDFVKLTPNIGQNSPDNTRIVEKDLQSGSNFHLYHMLTSPDGKITIGYGEDDDGYPHFLIGDENATFKDVLRLTYPVNGTALYEYNPNYMACAGSIGHGLDIGMANYSTDGGNNWITLDGSKMDPETTGGLKGQIRAVYFSPDGTQLWLFGSSGKPQDPRPYLSRVPLNGGKIVHTPVTGMDNVSLLTGVGKPMVVDSSTGTVKAIAALYPMGDTGLVTITPDNARVSKISNYSVDFFALTAKLNGRIINWTVLDTPPIAPNIGNGDMTFGTILPFVDDIQDAMFQVPESKFPGDYTRNYTASSISAAQQIPGTNDALFAMTLGRRETFIPALMIGRNTLVGGANNPDNFVPLNIQGDGWPPDAPVLGMQLFSRGEIIVARIVLGAGKTPDTNKGQVFDVFFTPDYSRPSRAIRSGWVGERVIQYNPKYTVYSPITPRNAVSTGIAPRSR